MKRSIILLAVLAVSACGTTATKTVTAIQYSPGPTVTQTVTQTVTAAAPTANSQGQATTITDGVYVIGKDIPAGTWHTPGGQQCYYALLSSDNTSAIITNNISSGPQTLTTSGAHALDISGGCTWTHES